jgi:hypothetical protein
MVGYYHSAQIKRLCIESDKLHRAGYVSLMDYYLEWYPK